MSITYILRDEYPRQGLEMMVSGHDRPIYFKRPIIPLLPQQMPDLAMQLPEEPQAQDSLNSTGHMELSKTTGVQTDYRESEAQTDPYSPEYMLAPGEEPEVLSFTYFTFSNGLPASMAEMELIEQAREKRLFEQMLPASTDEACFALRRKLMDEQEVKEWAKRESDIRRIQNERLNLLHTALLDREKENEERNAQRVEEIKLKKTEHKDRALVKIGRKRIKVLRKMFKARKAADMLGKKRDVIEEYADYGSRVYAGITREGMNLDKLANKYEVQPEVLTTYEGLRELTESLPEHILQTTLNIHEERLKIEKARTRKQVQHLAALSKAQKSIEESGQSEERGEDSKGQVRHSDADVRVRPDTPVVHAPDEDEKKYIAAVLIQRLLRGRAIQNAMHEGKEKRLDLIAELRRTGEMAELSSDEQERALVEAYQQRVLDGISEAIQGEFISQTFDVLSKELVRLKQERKIAAIVKYAERERRKKECEEAGRRQAEETLRAREDALFREILETNKGTVDTYLQKIITESVDEASVVQALDEAELRSRHLNKIVDNLEDRMNKPEMILKDLVSAFLIPEVERTKLQRQVQMQEKRHLLAARLVLKETAEQARRLKRDNA